MNIDCNKKIEAENFFLKKVNNELINYFVKNNFNKTAIEDVEVEALKEKILELEAEIVSVKRIRKNQIDISFDVRDGVDMLSIRCAKKSDLTLHYKKLLPIVIGFNTRRNANFLVDNLNINGIEIPDVKNIGSIFNEKELMRIMYLLSNTQLELVKKEKPEWSKKVNFLRGLINSCKEV